MPWERPSVGKIDPLSLGVGNIDPKWELTRLRCWVCSGLPYSPGLFASCGRKENIYLCHSVFFFPFFYVANLMKKLVLHVLTSLQSEGNLSIWDIAHQDLSARMKQSPSDGTRAADHTRALSSAQVAHPEFLCAITFWSFGQLSWRTVALTFSKWGEYSFSLC